MEDETVPAFSYSIGIQKTSNAPELIVFGLKKDLSFWIINEYNRRVRLGEQFSENTFYEGFLEGFSVTFKKVQKAHYKEFFGWALWLYEGSNFNALQMIYPTTSGVWPWEPEATEIFKNSTPFLFSNSD